MRRISFWHSWILALLITTGCGPSFEATNYNKALALFGGGLNPTLNEPGLGPGVNIVRNASLEQDLNLWEDWGGSSLLTGGAFSGGKAVRISGGSQGGLGQEVLFRIKTGGIYTLSAQAKIAAISDEVYLGLRFFNLSNGTISDQRVRITSTTYSLHSVQITVPKGASSAKVYVWKESSTNSFADFDDFTMTMVSEPPPPAKEPAIANPNNVQPNGVGGTYALVYAEEFNSTMTGSLNKGLWFNTTINGELQAYRPENVSLRSGYLQFIAEQRSASTTWGQSMNYASGAINTKDIFAFTMGFIEIRARLPRGAGLSSMFYLEPLNKRAPPEINFMTALGQSPTSVGFSYRFYDIYGAVKALIGSTNSADYSEAYHVYGVQWTEDTLRFYVDGVLRGSYTGDSILRDDAFIVVSLAVGGAIGGPVSAGFPQTMDVDYIRVWQ